MPENPLLEVKDLRITFRSRDAVNPAVKGTHFSLGRGETLAIVGERRQWQKRNGVGLVSIASATTGLFPIG